MENAFLNSMECRFRRAAFEPPREVAAVTVPLVKLRWREETAEAALEKFAYVLLPPSFKFFAATDVAKELEAFVRGKALAMD